MAQSQTEDEMRALEELGPERYCYVHVYDGLLGFQTVGDEWILTDTWVELPQ